MEIFSRQDEDDSDSDAVLWKYKAIVGHQGPLRKGHPDWKGSQYNVRVEWETGEVTYEPLSAIAKDDPVTCAFYPKKHGLLDLPGWKQFKNIAKKQKKML